MPVEPRITDPAILENIHRQTSRRPDYDVEAGRPTQVPSMDGGSRDETPIDEPKKSFTDFIVSNKVVITLIAVIAIILIILFVYYFWFMEKDSDKEKHTGRPPGYGPPYGAPPGFYPRQNMGPPPPDYRHGPSVGPPPAGPPPTAAPSKSAPPSAMKPVESTTSESSGISEKEKKVHFEEPVAETPQTLVEPQESAQRIEEFTTYVQE